MEIEQASATQFGPQHKIVIEPQHDWNRFSLKEIWAYRELLYFLVWRDIKVLAHRGNLYFSVPIGKPCVCFNAHRVHSPRQIMDYFYDFELVHFSGIDDRGTFRKRMDPNDLVDAIYACGLFHFTKRL